MYQLKCPLARLHIAGNDANFTLRLSLLLVVENYGRGGEECAEKKGVVRSQEDMERISERTSWETVDGFGAFFEEAE